MFRTVALIYDFISYDETRTVFAWLLFLFNMETVATAKLLAMIAREVTSSNPVLTPDFHCIFLAVIFLLDRDALWAGNKHLRILIPILIKLY